jgi:hypothetical protein
MVPRVDLGLTMLESLGNIGLLKSKHITESRLVDNVSSTVSCKTESTVDSIFCEADIVLS